MKLSHGCCVKVTASIIQVFLVLEIFCIFVCAVSFSGILFILCMLWKFHTNYISLQCNSLCKLELTVNSLITILCIQSWMYGGYTVETWQLIHCCQRSQLKLLVHAFGLLLTFCVTFQAVRTKYASSKFNKISAISELKSQRVKDLSEGAS